ncbi:MAG: hypothetical protein HPY78_02950 [Brevinematales bacterium]|nr:hypothetical protein [Brevinematales bacterium]
MKRWAKGILFWLFCMVVWAQEEPLESSRVPLSTLSASYFPSLSTESFLRYHAQFGVRGGFYNLFSEGPSLHLLYAMQHWYGDGVLLRETRGEGVYTNALQSYDVASVSLLSTVGKYYRMETGVEYVQNRLLQPVEGYDEYSFDLLKGKVALGWSTLRSRMEPWVEGYLPLYPQRGSYGNIGLGYNLSGTNQFLTMEGKLQVVFPLFSWWTLSFVTTAEGGLSSLLRPYKRSVYCIGGKPMVGDYVVWTGVEGRYYSPFGGWTFSTPEFWYFASYPVRLKAGFLAGVNGALAGHYDHFLASQYGVYVGPTIAIYVMEQLWGFLRFDVGMVMSGEQKIRLSFSIGGINEKPVPFIDIL